MIVTHKNNLIARCYERGYRLDEAMPCVVLQDGDVWAIDETHPSYPRNRKPPEHPIDASPRPGAVAMEPAGPGTELKKLLKKIGITATPTCSCNARARVMDERGIGWCENNIDEIVGWLREEATNRGLPFVDMAGRMLVRRAIKNAKRSETTPPAAAG